MKIVIRFAIYGFLFILLLDASPTDACTIFSVSEGERVMFGGNEDQYPNSSYIVADTFGTFGAVFLVTPWDGSPYVRQSGINEKGLCFDSNWIPEERIVYHPEKDSPILVTWMIMHEASTVEEVLSQIFNYNWGRSVDWQLHFADKTGDAAVIHPGADGELTYTRKTKDNSYLISTNFNLKFLDTGTWSCWRYETADRMLSTIRTQRDLTIEFMTSVLSATQNNTLYSVVYDLKKLKIYLYYHQEFDKQCALDVMQVLAQQNDYIKVPLTDLTYSDVERQKEGSSVSAVFLQLLLN